MQIYVAHSSKMDYQNELYIPIKKSSLIAKHTFILPHEFSANPESSKDAIFQSDLFLAEVSRPSTGLGIEMGWADAYQIPIYCFHKKETQASNSLNLVAQAIKTYISPEELIQKISKIIAEYEKLS